MKREFLEGLDLGNGAKLSKDAVEAIMAEHGKTVNPLKEQITTLTTDRDAWQNRAEAAEAIVEKLPKDMDPATIGETLKKAQDDLAAAKADYDTRLEERDFDDALGAAMGGYRFTSPAAQRDVERQIREAGLPAKGAEAPGAEQGVPGLLRGDRAPDPE